MNIKNFHIPSFVAVIFLLACGCSSPSALTDELFDDCTFAGTTDQLEVATLNLKEFPAEGNQTMDMAVQLIQSMKVDVLALQELSSEDALRQLADRLSGWEALVTPVPSGNMSVGYLYNASVLEIGSAKALFADDSYLFPRAPFQAEFTHRPTGHRVVLINLHLKAFGDSESANRRREAARKLKEYMDAELSNEKVVVLGDFNDSLKEPSNNDQTFAIWMSDDANYRFADLSIALGNPQWYSYPSYPSHIDHILVTNELFSAVDTVVTLHPDFCVPQFREVVSDHRPVVLYLR